MIKDINLVISLSDQLFQLAHFSLVPQIAAVEDAIDCRGSAKNKSNKKRVSSPNAPKCNPKNKLSVRRFSLAYHW